MPRKPSKVTRVAMAIARKQAQLDRIGRGYWSDLNKHGRAHYLALAEVAIREIERK